ncbi:NotI family restriction endonuclease [Synechococcus sp. H60.4]|uniref:NotI family restriction endonuclease n=1 Tax=unclassified Synechococcus TaxID=2626047 RepID=UPI0039C12C50
MQKSKWAGNGHSSPAPVSRSTREPDPCWGHNASLVTIRNNRKGGSPLEKSLECRFLALYKLILRLSASQDFPLGSEFSAKTKLAVNYLSSSRKRLVPQLVYKGGILRSWRKKIAVALNRSFFAALPPLEQVPKDEADTAC